MLTRPVEKSSSKNFPEKRGLSPFFCEAGVTCLFLGRVPVVPGTAGTLGGLAIAMMLPGGAAFPLWASVAALIAIALGWALTPWAESFYGRKDPSAFVLDEVAGYLLTVLPMQPRWTAAVLGFLLFRFFDIWKPWPCRRLEKLPGAAGIFLDDLVAGLYACVCLSAVRALYPEI